MQSSEEARDALVSKVVQLKRTEENINFIQGTYTLKLYLTGDLEFVIIGGSRTTVSETSTSNSSGMNSTPCVEKRGFLYKEGGSKKTWKLRYFNVHRGYFEYYKNATDVKPIRKVKLKNVTVTVTEPGLAIQPFQFAVHTNCEENKRDDWVFSAVKQEEMEDWMAVFTLAGDEK
ncbi:hypothetical protein EMCRGX_G024216 [Ephydatia muelleri]